MNQLAVGGLGRDGERVEESDVPLLCRVQDHEVQVLLELCNEGSVLRRGEVAVFLLEEFNGKEQRGDLVHNFGRSVDELGRQVALQEGVEAGYTNLAHQQKAHQRTGVVDAPLAGDLRRRTRRGRSRRSIIGGGVVGGGSNRTADTEERLLLLGVIRLSYKVRLASFRAAATVRRGGGGANY